MPQTGWACKDSVRQNDHGQEAGQTFCRWTVSQASRMVSEVLYTLLPSRAESGGSVQPSIPARLRKLFSVTLVSTKVLMNCSTAGRPGQNVGSMDCNIVRFLYEVQHCVMPATNAKCCVNTRVLMQCSWGDCLVSNRPC